ncbi:unnamed protein product [Lactuca saligna]|uniref:Uncharacterized protein n=1 Tax=Lactuca saligna TaxID=75948 RepID=A0AA35V0N8_LACSI|nr:unnamed protein product [Lactuca saligna]
MKGLPPNYVNMSSEIIKAPLCKGNESSLASSSSNLTLSSSSTNEGEVCEINKVSLNDLDVTKEMVLDNEENMESSNVTEYSQNIFCYFSKAGSDIKDPAKTETLEPVVPVFVQFR